jgi:hypothetical protein
MFSPLFIFSQEIDCGKFKTGSFRNIDSLTGDTFIERTEKYQIEYIKAIEVEIKLEITWLDECTYRLKFIKGNAAWEKMPQSINTPDLICKIIEVGEDYYVQISRFVDNPEFEYRSRIVRIKK